MMTNHDLHQKIIQKDGMHFETLRVIVNKPLHQLDNWVMGSYFFEDDNGKSLNMVTTSQII